MPNGWEANNEAALNERLAAFDTNPIAFMNELPPKFDETGKPIAGTSLFSDKAIQHKAYLEARDQQREQALADGPRLGTRAAIAANDLAANLVDELRYKKLQDMETAKLKSAKLAEQPWSDDYWGIYKGCLGARYGDPRFPESDDWKTNYNYIQTNKAADILKSGSTSRINQLSPAEKYDALLGDSAGTLTKLMWAEGQSFYDSTGSVETWMGLCHGWAVAAYMLPRPQASVTLFTPSNTPIKFFPADIKALATLLWANVPGSSRFIGGRCNDANPATDAATGRVTSQLCFDTNPGTWHLAIVNQIGVTKRSFVLDATFDYEVWNQPILGYSYTYFNPQTRRATTNLAEAKVAVSAFTNDKFKRFRSANARSIVGVSMTVSYMVEISPTQRDTDAPNLDAVQQVPYEYDLELDANDMIIGGEWYRNPHPDFLWTAIKNAKAQTRFETNASGTWNTRQALPPAWRTAGIQAASQQRAPLGKIVEQLLTLSKTASASTPSAPTTPPVRSTTPTTPSSTPTAPTTPRPAAPSNTTTGGYSNPTTTPTRPTTSGFSFLDWLRSFLGGR